MTDRNDPQRQTVVASRHDGRFNGKVAFVSGASSGIGRATALAFAREGAHVVVADVAAEDNRETARLIEQPIKPAHEIGDDEWDQLVAVNLRGAFIAMKHETDRTPPRASASTPSAPASSTPR